MNTKTKLRRRKTWLMLLLLLAGAMTGYAQSDYFEYEDDETISGLTTAGQAATSLTIPKEVTTVRSEAFSTAAKVSVLIIEDGGNPAFESELFGEKENPLEEIQIMGSSMTATNIRALLASLGAQGALETVYIEDYSGAWSDISETGVLTDEVSVILPAAKVSTQMFGDAKVYGRFELTKELVTFCGNATFQDTDDGSNMLFYVADACNKEEGYIHINRVRYVAAGQGVLIHNATGTSTYADLSRYDGEIPSAQQALYDTNMLVGVTTPTTIGRTDGDYTNLVLKNGAFHPTSGGTIAANKAYLQVPTSVLAAREMLTISFDEETNRVNEVYGDKEVNDDSWYDLQGRQFDTKPTAIGLYIVNGRKVSVK